MLLDLSLGQPLHSDLDQKFSEGAALIKFVICWGQPL